MSTYNERKNLYIQKNLNHSNYYALLLEAFSQTSPLNNDLLNKAIKDYQDEIIKTKDNSDFDLIFFIIIFIHFLFYFFIIFIFF